MSLRLAFLGTAEFAVPALEALIRAGHRVETVVCQPDRPRGRGHRVQAPPVKEAALRLGLKVRQPENLRDPAEAAALRSLGLDLACVVAYGQILTEEALSAPRLGCVNVHASLLPRWRGAAPIEWALASGDRETGVCVQRMVRRLDAGDVLVRRVRAVGPQDDAPGLHRELARDGAEALVEALRGLEAGGLDGEAQDESLATYAPLLRKADGFLDFRGTRRETLDRFRAFKERPGVRTVLAAGETVRLMELTPDAAGPSGPAGTWSVEPGGLRVSCSDGAVGVGRIVPPSGRPMPAADYVRGMGLASGAASRPDPGHPAPGEAT